MSALGQKPTYALQQAMSALPPIATSIAIFGMSALGQKPTDTVGANQSCRVALNQNDGHPKGYVHRPEPRSACVRPAWGEAPRADGDMNVPQVAISPARVMSR
jgi:hypothetical protein